MSQLHPTEKSLSLRQLIFVAVLLVLGLLISVLVVRFLDPAAARSISANCHQHSAIALEVTRT